MASLLSGLLKSPTFSLSLNFSPCYSILETFNQVRNKVTWRTRLLGPPDKRHRGPSSGKILYEHKPVQEWWEWDGKGPYKYRHHHYPNNITLRDVQRRRIFKKFHLEKSRINILRKNDLLPADLQSIADKQIADFPYDSGICRPNFRCVVTGRGRGNYNDYRVSRFVFRNEADHNRVSGVQRAFWLYNTHIKP